MVCENGEVCLDRFMYVTSYEFRVQVRAVHYVSIEFGLGDQIHCGQNSDSDFKTEVPRVLQVVEADEVE